MRSDAVQDTSPAFESTSHAFKYTSRAVFLSQGCHLGGSQSKRFKTPVCLMLAPRTRDGRGGMRILGCKALYQSCKIMCSRCTALADAKQGLRSVEYRLLPLVASIQSSMTNFMHRKDHSVGTRPFPVLTATSCQVRFWKLVAPIPVQSGNLLLL